MKTIRIESPGPKGSGTQIFDAETGAEIHGITSVRIDIAGTDPATVSAQLFGAHARVHGEACFYMVHPVTNQLTRVKAIEFVRIKGAEPTRWEA